MKKVITISGICGAMIIAAGLFTVLGMNHAQKVDANSLNVTHNAVAQNALDKFTGLGLKMNPLSNGSSKFVSEETVLNNTQQFMHDFKGKSRNITLINTSKKVGSSYATMSSAKAEGDPNFTHNGNKWSNIPCYLVTIEGATNTIPVLGTKTGTTATANGPSTVQILVDATNGHVLMVFQVQNTN